MSAQKAAVDAKAIDRALGDNVSALGKTPPVGMPKLYRIQIEEDERINPGGQYIGYNGKSYLIRAGFIVKVPKGVLKILDDAIEMVPVKDAYGKFIGSRPRKRIPYTRLPDEDEDDDKVAA